VITVVTAFACSVYLSFILVPLVVSYFLTFLLDPITELLTKRPLICCGRELCRDNLIKANRNRYERSAELGAAVAAMGAVKQFFLDIFLLGRLPHTVAVVVTLLCALAMVSLLTGCVIQSVESAWAAAAAHLPEHEGTEAGALYGAVLTWSDRVVVALQHQTGLQLRFSLNDLTRGVFSSSKGWSPQMYGLVLARLCLWWWGGGLSFGDARWPQADIPGQRSIQRVLLRVDGAPARGVHHGWAHF
jgi:predicted PurR-regulated permease PerM